MNIAVGADHAGFEAKERLKELLERLGHRVEDVGTHSVASVDYPDYAFEVGVRVADARADLGVLVCGSGIGVSIAANKVHGVRAAVCTDGYSAALARRHNDANVLCVGARITGPGLMESIVESFLEATFEGGRHARRVDKINRRDEEGASR